MFEAISELSIKRCLVSGIPAVFEIHDSIDSTNIRAKALAKAGAETFYVVIADHQFAGHGRFGRQFFSPAGCGIYMSFILHPEISASETSNLTSFTAVAVARAIENLCKYKVGIKWVNDLFMNCRKICGILVESSVNPLSDKLDYAVVGIGINVLKAEIPEALTEVITSIEEQTNLKISRNELIAEILNQFLDYETALLSGNYLEEYRQKSIILGKKIKVIHGNETFEAIARQIDDTAALVVECNDGSIQKINAGEVSIRI